MSKLSYFGRPFVAFDSQNREHRRWFAEFQRTGTWGRCPIRFICPEEHGDLITLIQRKLIAYYIDQEFAVDMTKRTDEYFGKIAA